MNPSMNGGMRGPGGPPGGLRRGGGPGMMMRGGRGGPRGGVSRFSGGPQDLKQQPPRGSPNNTNNRPVPMTNNRPSGPNMNNRPPPVNVNNRPPPITKTEVPVKKEEIKTVQTETRPENNRQQDNRPDNRQDNRQQDNRQDNRQQDNRQQDNRQDNRQQDNRQDNRGPPNNRGGAGLMGANPGANRGGGGGGANRFQRRDGDNQRGGPRNQDDRLMEKVAALSGPTYDLPTQETEERKFSGHCRLYVGNLTNDITEDEVTALFTPFGQTSELFLNKDKNFAFIRLDYRASAEKAKRELDGSLRKNRQLKVRFAPHSAAIKVKNLTQHVSNELLEVAFSIFGEIERAYVIVDDRGKSQGEGIVEFARKPGAQLAMRKCSEQCFFLTASLRPVICEPYEQLVDPDGLPDKNMFKKSPDYIKAREVGPRFASAESFEHDYGTRWKQLHELRKQKLEALERELKLEEEKLEAQMEHAKYEHETQMLREQLRQREADRERQKREWEMKERQQEEQRRQDDEMMRRQQEEMQMRMMRQEEDMRRRQQENSLFMQAHQLTSLLDQQEQAMRGGGAGGGGGAGAGGAGAGNGGYPPMSRDYDQPGMPADNYGGMRGSGGPGNLPVDPKAFMDTYDRGGAGGGVSGGRFDLDDMGGRGGSGGMVRQQPRWGGGGQDRRPPMVDDYPNKRRRY